MRLKTSTPQVFRDLEPEQEEGKEQTSFVSDLGLQGHSNSLWFFRGLKYFFNLLNNSSTFVIGQ